MTTPEIPQFEVWAAKLAGVAGAVVSMLLTTGSKKEKVAAFICGAAMAHFIGPYAAVLLNAPTHLAEIVRNASIFGVGLLGYVVARRVWRFIDEAPLAEVWRAVIDRIRGAKGG